MRHANNAPDLSHTKVLLGHQKKDAGLYVRQNQHHEEQSEQAEDGAHCWHLI
jgi:hypothetical protein